MITQQFDLPMLRWVAENLRSPFGDAVMPAITFLGDGGWIWIALAIFLLCLPKCRHTGLAMAVALLMGLVVCNLILKPLVGRMRPFDYEWLHFGNAIPLLIDAPTDYSFPSGHTIASFEAAAVLLLRHKKRGIPALLLAALIAFSRLYLYVHYPTDVLASMVLGIGIASWANHLIDKGYPLLINHFKEKKEKSL